jgi:hypothetical protein
LSFLYYILILHKKKAKRKFLAFSTETPRGSEESWGLEIGMDATAFAFSVCLRCSNQVVLLIIVRLLFPCSTYFFKQAYGLQRSELRFASPTRTLFFFLPP